VNVRRALVAQQLAHIRTEGDAWRCGTTATRKQKSPPRQCRAGV
jgi:hypothetical protein